MANLIRDYFCQCLEKCPHFSLIADETTSHGREILSVCLRFLDFVEDPCRPIKRDVLIDLCDLTRTTGKAIATTLTESLKKHKIDITNCRGQAYDTTSSMSSSKKGVQAEIAKCAPDADYQGCCPIQNMMDSCRELYSFFDNSPKWQRLLDIVIEVLGKGEAKKRKLMDWASLNVWNNLRSIRIRSPYPRWNLRSLGGWALWMSWQGGMGLGCQYSNIGKWTETHNEKLWAHFPVLCARWTCWNQWEHLLVHSKVAS